MPRRGLKRALLLVAVGTVAMVGDLAGVDALYGLGMATHASPAPKVFTEREGLEGFSAGYRLEWEAEDGPHELPLTPEVYARLDGPYNRRNVYGAALAGGPFLSEHPLMADLHRAVAQHAFCDAGVLEELGESAAPVGPVRLVVEPREGTQTPLPLVLEVSC